MVELPKPLYFTKLFSAALSFLITNHLTYQIKTLYTTEIIKCYRRLLYHLPHIQQLYLKLFNLVFDTGHIPETWSIGKIIPVYKQKGGPIDPSNYRPITLLSCMGKLFTSVINNRLQAYSEEPSKINNCQAGFRKKFSTTYHIFVLHTLINILQSGRKKNILWIYRSQAFDSVWRDGLFYKIKQFDITGKCFRLIKNMMESSHVFL